ncbi:prolipoprotein diacylglyceryl transferase [Edaphobacillus lindanitolerans]|uniref:Uncharacterized protein n=1 Tax=Edaphobacillus lindanitolerans TaxID=550447 RepID=A0A1U7PMR8_9BACI|nr:hypothetical protein [Edaphobacillus lindanitolerans]SIT83378.1 hypothetical protein SAMN05428946_1609 [Edaphobacillus lindanitolerans]
MGMSTWSMEQTFRFPQSCGEPVRAESVNVTPQYSDERTDNSYRLTGVYHMTCMTVFEGEEAAQLPEGATMVEEIEMDGETGYFEYAVPLYIDLPADKTEAASLKAHDVRAHVMDDGAFCVSWKVDCEWDAESEEDHAEVRKEERAVSQEEKQPAREELAAAPKEKASAVPEEKAEAPLKAVVAEQPAPERTAYAAESPYAESPTGAARADDVSMPDAPDEAKAFIAGLEDTYTVFSYPSYKIFVKSESDSD